MNEEAAAAAHLEEVAFQRGRAEGRLTAMADSEARGHAAGVEEAVEALTEDVENAQDALRAYLNSECCPSGFTRDEIRAAVSRLDAALARLRKEGA